MLTQELYSSRRIEWNFRDSLHGHWARHRTYDCRDSRYALFSIPDSFLPPLLAVERDWDMANVEHWCGAYTFWTQRQLLLSPALFSPSTPALGEV